jgi:hypothetical protein
VIFWLLSFSWAEVSCPKKDLYAKGLDAYTILIEEEPVSLRFSLDFTAGDPEREIWRVLLVDCGREKALNSFEAFVLESQYLVDLGTEWQKVDPWRWKERWKHRRKISQQEKEAAKGYVHFLRTLERETGVAVRWNPQGHVLAKGMISTARGSDLIADYVSIVWDLGTFY